MQTIPDLSRSGYAMMESVFDTEAIRPLITSIESHIHTTEGKGGVRNLLDYPEMAQLAGSHEVRVLVEPILGPDAKVVRGILFDKTDGANWKVPWHQDVTIAVDRRIDAEGYGPWSIKAGVLHVQPPREILEQMISVRIHLDDCPEENGALKVIPGSHLAGKLSATTAEEAVAQGRVEVCALSIGGVLLMRPLLLHASSAASSPKHRRVIHFDFAAAELPSGLDWAI